MDRCAVFVDAGYLYAEGGKLIGLGPSRRNVRLDASGANQFLVNLATTGCHLPVLRTYWYDGAREGIPTTEHQAISDLPNVKLRLGRLNQRNQQKGVDALIYHDLMTLARERAICDAFLLSGDEDLREGVRAAQEIGIRVTLIGIRTPSGARNQSRDLAREADEVIMLTSEDVSAFIVQAPEVGEMSQASDDPTEAIATASAEYAESWLDRADDEEIASLMAARPYIPRPLDADLVRAIEGRVGVSLRGQDSLKRSARKVFWERIGQGRDGVGVRVASR